MVDILSDTSALECRRTGRATGSCVGVFAAVQLLVGVCVSVAGLSPSDGMRRTLPKLLPTRLETRTKESNLYASSRVLKLECAMNVKVLFRGLTDDPL